MNLLPSQIFRVSMFVFVASSSAPLPVAAGNFLCSDPEILATAEAARIQSAIFWSGRELPGDWMSPCPVWVQFRDAPAGGSTTFTFENGEVFGWSMSVTGRRAEILRDVIPHEVDHMVRASLNRKPIERWLDEGCASFMESADSRARLRKTANQLPVQMITSTWLNARDYPSDCRDVHSLYALGHSLVELLLRRDTPMKLLEFQRLPGNIETRLRRCFSLTVDQLRDEWKRQRTAPPSQKGTAPPTGTLPTLIVWTAPWCAPCLQFQRDFQTDATFRRHLTSRFRVIINRFDQSREEAQRRGINTLPTFEVAGHQIQGYRSAAELLEQLDAIPMSRLLDLEPATPRKDEPTPSVPGTHGHDEEPHGGSPPLGGRHFLLNTDTLVPDLPGITSLPSNSSPAEVAQPSPSLPIASQPAPATAPVRKSDWPTAMSRMIQVARWTGLLSGTFATGGLAGILLAIVPVLWQRRRARRLGQNSWTTGGTAPVAAPFPRRLDEAGQLLELRRAEGRVAVLDALRGMFLDDELEKLESEKTSGVTEFATRLRGAIDSRVDEVAPLTTQV